MTKRKIYLKLGILFFGISLIIHSCQKEPFDDFQEQAKEKKLKMISLNEFKSRVGESKGYEKLSKLFDIKKESTTQLGRLEQTDNTWLMTDEIVMVEKEGATFYTFRVGTETESASFYNFIVVMDENSNIISTRILEYVPSNAWLQDTSQPFSGEVKTQENNIFSDGDVDALFLERGSSQCITGVSGAWECSFGNNHGPGECNAKSFDYIVTIDYGSCPPELTSGEDDGYPIDTTTSGPGGGSGMGGNNNNNDNDDCVPSIDNPCNQEETAVLKPKEDEEEEDDCNTSEEDFNAYYSANSPFDVDLSAVSNCYSVDMEDIEENQKFMCIYNKLTQSPKFKNLFLDTFGESDNLNVKFEISDSITANGTAGGSYTIQGDGTITTNWVITIKKSALETESNISLAKIILHECIHTYLKNKMINCDLGSSLPYLQNSELSEIINTFYNDWNCEPNINGSPQSQHSFMFNYMLPSFEEILTEIKDLLVSQGNFAFFDDISYTDEDLDIDEDWNWQNFIHYYSMAGLHNSSAFSEAILNNPVENFLYQKYLTSEGYFSSNCLE